MKRLIPLLAAGIMASLIVMAGIGAVHAQEKAEARFNGAVAPRRISMGVGMSRIIELSEDAAEIFVANPKVANAVVRSPRKLYVIGMDAGQTSVVALDQQGRQIADLELSIDAPKIYAPGIDIRGLRQMLHTVMPTAAITPRTVKDTIILTGDVNSIEDAQRAVDIAKAFLQLTPGGDPRGAQGAPTTNGTSPTPTLSPTFGSTPPAQLAGRIVNMLTVGGEIPIPTAPSCTGNGVCQIGTEFKDYGVSLGFTPVVLAEGRILLRLVTEVTEIDTQTAQIISGTLVPGFLTRKNETTVEVPSGGSIASAGLLQTISKQAINGLPGLLDLPILGALFRSNDYQKQETELMIIVTPFIVKPAKPDEIARPTDGFADASDPQAWLLGRVNQLYASPGNPEAIKDYKGPVGFIQD